MNANELAEIIEHLENARYIGASKAAKMLRQQQAEIEALKAGKIRAYDNGVEDGRKPDTNNKPVAWMAGVEGGTMYTNYEYPNSIPLYTHPAELTDEEILKMAADKFHYSEYKLVIDFARAILRKAGA